MILDEILKAKKDEVRGRRRARPFAGLYREAESRADRRPFRRALAGEGISLVAEIKKASPSEGTIRADFDPGKIAGAYERGGAAAISVLTDGPYFGGDLAHLAAARGAAGLPLLRKDFVIDEYQIAEAGAAGADAFLLIVAALSRDRIAGYLALGRELGLDALVEAHDGREVEIALASGADLVGVNNRDLRTFTVDLETSIRLASAFPEGVVRVSESGIGTSRDMDRLRAAGYHAALVGTSLMRADSPEAAARRLLGGGA
ncbi:MAG: indole-3-glycerol phosphate synthase TrpC [Candidatus Eisenbacteria bacterium]